MHPVVRMRSVVRAFLNCTSYVYVEPVNRSTYVVPERNGKFFWRLLEQRAVLPESASDEETAANAGRRSEQRAVLPKSVRDEEREAHTGKTSEQRAALPESARAEERATNTGRRSEWRAALPGSTGDVGRADHTNTRHETLYCLYRPTVKVVHLLSRLLLFTNQQE